MKNILITEGNFPSHGKEKRLCHFFFLLRINFNLENDTKILVIYIVSKRNIISAIEFKTFYLTVLFSRAIQTLYAWAIFTLANNIFYPGV